MRAITNIELDGVGSKSPVKWALPTRTKKLGTAWVQCAPAPCTRRALAVRLGSGAPFIPVRRSRLSSTLPAGAFGRCGGGLGMPTLHERTGGQRRRFGSARLREGAAPLPGAASWLSAAPGVVWGAMGSLRSLEPHYHHPIVYTRKTTG